MRQEVGGYFGLWGTALLWGCMTNAFLLFLPFYRYRYRRAVLLFTVISFAYTLEKYVAPLSRRFVYFVTGYGLPEGFLWGNTFFGWIGTAGNSLYLLFILFGGILVVAGWSQIYGTVQNEPDGRIGLVSSGVYRYLRHPQYTGLMLISAASLYDWATIPLLIAWPVLVRTLIGLAREEDRYLQHLFGGAWDAYAERTGRFIPKIGNPK